MNTTTNVENTATSPSESMSYKRDYTFSHSVCIRQPFQFCDICYSRLFSFSTIHNSILIQLVVVVRVCKLDFDICDICFSYMNFSLLLCGLYGMTIESCLVFFPLSMKI